MENYNYTLEELNLHWRIKSHNKITANHDNKCLFKQFRSDLHLDKAENSNISYLLPKSYLIVTNEISYLFNIRDKILIRIHHNKYLKVQEQIDTDYETKNNEYKLVKERRIIEKADLDSLKSQLNSIKNPGNRIAMQSRVAKAKAKLDNTDLAIAHYEADLKNMQTIREKNQEEWAKQVTSIEKTINIALGEYLKKATRKIEKKYGFTEFTYDIKPYDSELQKIVNGEI